MPYSPDFRWLFVIRFHDGLKLSAIVGGACRKPLEQLERGETGPTCFEHLCDYILL